ncbi:MAG: hypothetical protein EOM54_12985, partial [Clostridia bacterium]|nr:hypothetical protein [Clostridia bacterium]
MKKVIIPILLVCLLVALPLHVNAQTAGQVLYTDIGVRIDEQPIEAYNIGGHTYIIAEDLRGYGFDVVWDAAVRTLSVTRDSATDRSFLSKDKINVKKSDIPVGRRAFDVYATDIKTTVGGREVNAYNISGRTLIRITELADYGYLSYDNASRMVTLEMLKSDIDKAYDASAKEALTLPCDKIEGTITYFGDVSGGVPDGSGKITEHYDYTNGLQSVEDYSYTGTFKNGGFDGTVYYEGYRHPQNGTDTRDSSYLSYLTYKDGVPDGYTLQCELIKYCTRNEYLYDNGKITWERLSVIDPQYLYGYYVTDEGNIDALGAIIDYEKTESTPKIVSVEAGNSASFAIDENNTLYYFGETNIEGLPRRTVPVKIDSGIAEVSADGYLSVTDTEGNLYHLADKLFKYKNTDVPKAASGVTSFTSTAYLDGVGTLWLRPVDFSFTLYDVPTKADTGVAAFSGDSFILYIKNDGSVWTFRKNFKAGSGSTWNDGLDLSSPRKVMDGGKYVNADSGYFVIKDDNSLWTWTSCYYGTGYESLSDSGITEPVKLADGVAEVGSANGNYIAYLKTDGTLWVLPDTRFDENTPLFEDLTAPVKLADNVKTFSCAWAHMLIVKNDG